MLVNANPNFTKPSDKKVEEFIRLEHEHGIKKFFMEDIEGALEKYEFGLPVMKPDVLKQIVELEEKRKKMMEEKKNDPENLTVQINGGPPEKLNLQNAIKIIQIQSQDIEKLKARIVELEKQI